MVNRNASEKFLKQGLTFDDVLLIPALTLLGNKAKADQTVELLRSYGVSVKSASN